MNFWTTSTCLPKQHLIVGTCSSFQSKTQIPKIRKPSRARDWWLLHHQSKTDAYMKSAPRWLESLHRSHLIVGLSVFSDMSNICFIVRSFPIFLMECKFIKECLLLSCVASFEDWSSIFRTRSFTLCKNDLDFNDMSDSATVLESISSSSTINLSVCSVNKLGRCSLTDFPVLRCCLVHELRGNWLSYLVFTGLFDAVEASTSGVLSLHRETKFIIGFDFAVTLSSPASSCVLFDTTSRQLVELKWLMLNTKDDSIHHVWNFPLSVCLRVGSWCQCIWCGSWGPNWFYRIINQEQLCGFWKHVSLPGFFPLQLSWSLLRCLQTHTTKLPDEKNWRLRE